MANFLSRYLKESVQEMRRVSWPTKNQLIHYCVIVIAFIIASALIMAGVDFLFNTGYQYLLTLR